jgi:hypothetical protein
MPGFNFRQENRHSCKNTTHLKVLSFEMDLSESGTGVIRKDLIFKGQGRGDF